MADSILSLLEQNSTTGIAVGGALMAVAVGLTAVKVLSGGKVLSSSETRMASKKKKNKTKSKKKTVETAAAAAVAAADREMASPINLEEFVDDGPDSEEEEIIRAEKRKLKLKQKKKNAKAKQRATVSSSDKPVVDAEKEKEKKKAASVALKQDADDGWETVVSKRKAAKSKQQ